MPAEVAEGVVLDRFKLGMRADIAEIGNKARMARAINAKQSAFLASLPPEAAATEDAAALRAALAEAEGWLPSLAEMARSNLVATQRFGDLVGYDLTAFVRQMWGLTTFTPDATEGPEDLAYARRMAQAFRDRTAELVIP